MRVKSHQIHRILHCVHQGTGILDLRALPTTQFPPRGCQSSLSVASVVCEEDHQQPSRARLSVAIEHEQW